MVVVVATTGMRQSIRSTVGVLDGESTEGEDNWAPNPIADKKVFYNRNPCRDGAELASSQPDFAADPFHCRVYSERPGQTPVLSSQQKDMSRHPQGWTRDRHSP